MAMYYNWNAPSTRWTLVWGCFCPLLFLGSHHLLVSPLETETRSVLLQTWFVLLQTRCLPIINPNFLKFIKFIKVPWFPTCPCLNCLLLDTWHPRGSQPQLTLVFHTLQLRLDVPRRGGGPSASSWSDGIDGWISSVRDPLGTPSPISFQIFQYRIGDSYGSSLGATSTWKLDEAGRFRHLHPCVAKCGDRTRPFWNWETKTSSVLI